MNFIAIDVDGNKKFVRGIEGLRLDLYTKVKESIDDNDTISVFFEKPDADFGYLEEILSGKLVSLLQFENYYRGIFNVSCEFNELKALSQALKLKVSNSPRIYPCNVIQGRYEDLFVQNISNRKRLNVGEVMAKVQTARENYATCLKKKMNGKMLTWNEVIVFQNYLDKCEKVYHFSETDEDILRMALK